MEEKGQSAEEKEISKFVSDVEIKNKKPKDKKTDLTEAETFEVLEGKGVKYPTFSGKIYIIRPMCIKETRTFLKLAGLVDKLVDPATAEKALDEIAETFAKYFNKKKDEIETDCDMSDYRKMVGLMSTVISTGKDLFKKKAVSLPGA